MFVDVESFFFNACRNAQTVYLVEYGEDDVSHQGCPCSYDQSSEQLGSEEAPAGSIKDTFAGGEQAGQDGARKSADAVYRAGTDGVVNLQDFFLLGGIRREEPIVRDCCTESLVRIA